ncbi:unnamed protein product [Schistocephalus solidus]|uniref:Aha1_N domain-containing protein n=1 Tax=Schistocephalus solidus TaxID=70667 RepID=A0A183TI10_SCHSO|nr:unnamed protein product [Schistocephalus solidus]
MEEENVLRSLRLDDSIIVEAADKGGETVVMNKIDYVNKDNQAFHDWEAWLPNAEDPTKKQAASLKKKVIELIRLKLISTADSNFPTLKDPHIAPSSSSLSADWSAEVELSGGTLSLTLYGQSRECISVAVSCIVGIVVAVGVQ